MPYRTNENPQDLRVQRTYRLLKGAFVHLIAQKTFEQITVQEICEEAMVRRTTFYQHFEDKNDFLNWFLRENQLAFDRSIDECVSPGHLKEYYISLVNGAMKYMRENKQLLQLLFGAGVQQQSLIHEFAEKLIESINRHLNNIPDIETRLDHVPVSLLAEFYVGGMFTALRWYFNHDCICTDEEFNRYINRILLGWGWRGEQKTPASAE